MSDIIKSSVDLGPLASWITNIPLVITSVDYPGDLPLDELKLRITALASFSQETVWTEEQLLPLDATMATICLVSAQLSAKGWAKLEELAFLAS